MLKRMLQVIEETRLRKKGRTLMEVRTQTQFKGLA
jgi:hypothetical protein